MIIYNFNKYIKRTFPPVNILWAIYCYNDDRTRVEELIKKEILDFAFACHEKERLHKMELLIGLTPDGSSYDKISGIKYAIAHNYLRELLDKKYIEKFYIIKKPFKFRSKQGSNAKIKACISMMPKKAIKLFEHRSSAKRQELFEKHQIT